MVNDCVDAIGHGVMHRQDSNGRRHGWWPRCYVRAVHGLSTDMLLTHFEEKANNVKMRYDTPMSGPLPVNTPTTKPTTAATGAAATAGVKPSTVATSNLNSVSATTLPSVSAGSATATLPGTAVPLTDLPMRQQIKAGLRDMYRSSVSSGKNFAKVGAIFSGTECAIEGLRAKNDLYNGVAGGCLTGGILARNAGPQAVVVGCAGFAVFSAAIDAYMRMPEDERSKPIA